jgi:hypothetical protein
MDGPPAGTLSVSSIATSASTVGQPGATGHAIDIYRELGARYNEAESLNQLGNVHHASGSQDAARTAWQQALTIMESLRHDDAAELRSKLERLDGRDVR